MTHTEFWPMPTLKPLWRIAQGMLCSAACWGANFTVVVRQTRKRLGNRNVSIAQSSLPAVLHRPSGWFLFRLALKLVLLTQVLVFPGWPDSPECAVLNAAAAVIAG
jgi:hypothetical protein